MNGPGLEMTAMESTRPGWIGRAIGGGFILLAIGLTVWDLQATGGIVWLNLITLAAGVVNFHLGTIRIRHAREHHEFMEEQRRRRPEGDAMSWTELMPGGPGTPPGLTLGDCLRRGEGGHCADCIKDGEPCPDHRQDAP